MRSVEGAAGGRTDRDRDQRLWRRSASKRPPAAEHGLTVPAGAGKTTLCARSRRRLPSRRFARDRDNLTLATGRLKRHEKVAKDAAERQPKHNQCWFAGRMLAVKVEYGLTVDPRQRDALEAMLDGCRIEHVVRSYRSEPSS